jgi:uncharacterized protein YjiS (DUF1127 family)
MYRTPMHNRFAEGFEEPFSSGDTIDPMSARVLDRDWLDGDLRSVHSRARAARDAALAAWLGEISASMGCALARLGRSLVNVVRTWRHRHRMAEELYGLDRRALADLGLNRSDIPFIVAGWSLDRDARDRDPQPPDAANRNCRGRDAA